MTGLRNLLLCAFTFLFSASLAYAASGDGPPENPVHSIALYENGVLKEEKPAAEYPEEIRFKKAGGKWVPVTRIEVGFIGKGGRVDSSDEATRIVIYYYGADGKAIDHLTLEKFPPRVPSDRP